MSETPEKLMKLNKSDLVEVIGTLTTKMNSISDALQKAEQDKIRIGIVAKVNTLNPTFKPTAEMSDEFLQGCFHAWSNPLSKPTAKKNAAGQTPPTSSTKKKLFTPTGYVDDDGLVPKANRLDIPEAESVM